MIPSSRLQASVVPTIATSPVHGTAVCGCVSASTIYGPSRVWAFVRTLHYPSESSTKTAPPPAQAPPDLMKIAFSRRTGVVLDNLPVSQALGRSSSGRMLRIIVDHKSASNFKLPIPGEHLGGDRSRTHEIPRAPPSLLNTKSVGVLPYLIHPGTRHH